jgi:putative transposase
MSKKKHEVPEELLAGLLANYKNPEDLIGEEGLLKHLTKLVVERALEAELSEHLGHGKHESVANDTGNTRNGKSRKTLKGNLVSCRLKFPVTVMAALSRSWCPNIRRVGRGSTTRLFRCMPEA